MPSAEFDYDATTGYFNDIGSAPLDGQAAVTYQWSTGYIDNGPVDGHPISLALEFRGNLNIPHFAYRTAVVGESRLQHTYWDPPNWIRETVLSSTQVGGDEIGYAASIAIDRFGGPHIAFVRAAANRTFNVMYVRRQGSAWNVDTVQSGIIGFPSRTSIALDPDGAPHIAYSNSNRGGTIRHAMLVGGLWKREIIAIGVGDADFTAIDINRLGAPHISYYSESDRAIQSTRLEELNWNGDTIAGSVGVKNPRLDTSIQFDASGVPHICYFNGGTNRLEHAQLSGSTWAHDVVENSNSAGFADIAVDRNGILRASYFDQQNLRYAERRSGAWTSVTVDQLSGAYTSIAVDLSGRPYIAYYDSQQADAMLAIGQ